MNLKLKSVLFRHLDCNRSTDCTDKERVMIMRQKKSNYITRIFLFALLALLGVSSSTIAAGSGGETAADFLLISVGARAAGMGGAYSSIAEGAQANYWNPAGLPFVDKGEVIFGHYDWLQDISMEHGAIAYKLNEKTSLGFSVTYLNYGVIEGFDDAGISTGELSAYDLAISASVGKKVMDNLSFGLTGKLINQKLDDITGTGFALDFGAKYLYDNYSIGIVVANFGDKLSFGSTEEALPMTTRLGISGLFLSNSLLAAVDFEKKKQGELVVRNGFEYSHNGNYFLRSGYNLYSGNDNQSTGSGISFGAGATLSQFQLDYALTIGNNSISDNVHRFSVLFYIN